MAADNDAGSLRTAGSDIAFDAFPLTFADHGADLCGGVEGIADPLFGDGLGERIDEFVFAGAGNQQPGLGDAGLTIDHERHR